MAYSRKISDGQFFSGCDMAPRRSTTPSPSSGFSCSSSAPVLLPDSFAIKKTTIAAVQSHPSPTSFTFFPRAWSPTRLSAYRGIILRSSSSGNNNDTQMRTTSCDCSTQHHPLAYRCPLHRRKSIPQTAPTRSKSTRLNCRRSAMANSLLRLGVEAELVKRSLSKLVRRSSNLDELLRRRREGFHPKPSRLSAMTKAEDP